MLVPDVPEDVQERAAAGPHAHWSGIGFNLEGGRLHMIHEEASSPNPDHARIEELKAQVLKLVESMAYGQADSFYYEFSKYLGEEPSEDGENEEMRIQAEIYYADLFDVYMHSDYMQDMQKSIRLIQAASADPATAALMDGFLLECFDAFERGRDMRTEQEVPSSDDAGGASPSP